MPSNWSCTSCKIFSKENPDQPIMSCVILWHSFCTSCCFLSSYKYPAKQQKVIAECVSTRVRELHFDLAPIRLEHHFQSSSATSRQAQLRHRLSVLPPLNTRDWRTLFQRTDTGHVHTFESAPLQAQPLYSLFFRPPKTSTVCLAISYHVCFATSGSMLCAFFPIAAGLPHTAHPTDDRPSKGTSVKKHFLLFSEKELVSDVKFCEAKQSHTQWWKVNKTECR